MMKTEFDFNEEADEQKIRDALDDINNRITAFEQEQLEDNEQEYDEPLWPSISNRD